MSGNIFGKYFKLVTFGESHGKCIGGVLDGVPSLVELDFDLIQKKLDRRKPGKTKYETQRQEEDKVEFLSGIYEGKTLGTPIAFIIKNQNSKSKDYEEYKDVFRPGHGDYTYWKKYGINDNRGGGRASARETASRVVGGAIAEQALKFIGLKSIKIKCCVTQIGEITAENIDWENIDNKIENSPFFFGDLSKEEMLKNYFDELMTNGLSVGAKIEARIEGVPLGLGEPVFDKLNADLAKALMSINAAKAIEIGDGIGSITSKRGFDEMFVDCNDEIKFLSNTSGGILAGISTGQDIICKVSFKPTSSTLELRRTISKDKTNKEITIKGRHDPCVGIRAVPVVESMIALTLIDHVLYNKFNDKFN